MGNREDNTLRGAAVFFANDDILRHVDQAASQISRVRCAQCRVSQTLSRTVGGDKVLGHTQTFAVAGDNRTGNHFTARVRDQSTHTGDVSDLQPVTTGSRGHHPVNRVVLLECLTHRLVHLTGALAPDFHEFATTLLVGDKTAVKLRLHFLRLLLVLGDNLVLLLRARHVTQGNGHTGARRPVEAGVLDLVQSVGDHNLRVPLGEVVDQRRHTALINHGL